MTYQVDSLQLDVYEDDWVRQKSNSLAADCGNVDWAPKVTRDGPIVVWKERASFSRSASKSIDSYIFDCRQDPEDAGVNEDSIRTGDQGRPAHVDSKRTLLSVDSSLQRRSNFLDETYTTHRGKLEDLEDRLEIERYAILALESNSGAAIRAESDNHARQGCARILPFDSETEMDPMAASRSVYHQEDNEEARDEVELSREGVSRHESRSFSIASTDKYQQSSREKSKNALDQQSQSSKDAPPKPLYDPVAVEDAVQKVEIASATPRICVDDARTVEYHEHKGIVVAEGPHSDMWGEISDAAGIISRHYDVELLERSYPARRKEKKAYRKALTLFRRRAKELNLTEKELFALVWDDTGGKNKMATFDEESTDHESEGGDSLTGLSALDDSLDRYVEVFEGMCKNIGCE